MNRKKIYLLAVIVLVAVPVVFSVSTGSIGWLKNSNNGKNKQQKSVIPESVETGDIRYEIRYQSAEKRRKQSGTDTIAPGADDMIVYELRIESDKQRDLLKEDKENRIRYFGSLVQKDLRLVIGKDTAACIMAHLEQTYGLVPHLSVQVAFPKMIGWKEQIHTIILYDRYFSNGPLVMKHQLKENEI
jgi:hypothetical protein